MPSTDGKRGFGAGVVTRMPSIDGKRGFGAGLVTAEAVD
jgi:hypothetical protein